MSKISGVYEIRNILNNHRYIGSSVNILKRFGEHLRMLTHNNHHSIYLQRAWNKYGKNKFEFNILETCESIKDTILFLEQKYLDLNPEYNTCKNARNTQGVIFTEERKRKIGVANSKRIIKEETRIKHSINSKNSEYNKKIRKPIYMIDLNSKNKIKEFDSIISASLFLGKYNYRVGIKRVLQGKQSKAYGYMWKLKN